MGKPSTRKIEFEVGGQKCRLPVTMWQQLVGPHPLPHFKCNGCTASPDWLIKVRCGLGLGLYAVWPACVIHDYHYNGRIRLTRKEADDRFRENLWRVLRMQDCPAIRAWVVSRVYWAAVRLLGKDHYKERT